VEFRNALRKLNLGLTSREIDKLMAKIDSNSDGKIDWQEFMSKFKTSDLDERMKERAKDKMARLKELMIMHMTSPNDAFRFVSIIK
jgi:Ca2+-binding EF-hand superfamily protein